MLTCGKREVLEHVHSDICFQTVGAPEEIVQREGTTSDDLSAAPAANSEPTAVDLKAYLDEKQGSFSFTLVDQNNQPLPKDENGNYIVSPGTGYQLALHITSPGGFIPETLSVPASKGSDSEKRQRILCGGWYRDWNLDSGRKRADDLSF